METRAKIERTERLAAAERMRGPERIAAGQTIVPGYTPGDIRTAYCKTDAGPGSTIVCYLDEDDEDSDEVTVYCDISGGSALNAALRRLEDGDRLKVHYNSITSHWECLEGFMASEDCDE